MRGNFHRKLGLMKSKEARRYETRRDEATREEKRREEKREQGGEKKGRENKRKRENKKERQASGVFQGQPTARHFCHSVRQLQLQLSISDCRH